MESTTTQTPTLTDWLTFSFVIGVTLISAGYLAWLLWKKFRWDLPCALGVTSLFFWICNASNPEHWSRDGLHLVWLVISFVIIIPSAELAERGY